MAPQGDPATGSVFDRLTDVERWSLGAPLPAMPPKEVFLPQMDCILDYGYDRERQEVRLEPHLNERPKAVIGIRPCDLAGLQCLDRFLIGQEFVDEVFLARRKKTLIVVETCTEPFRDCFCVCTDSGPAAQEGYDLSITDISDGGEPVYLVEVGSEKGRELAGNAGWRRAGDRDMERKAEVVDRSIRRFPDLATKNKAWVSRMMNRVTTGFIKHETWEYVGKQCFECGGCSFVCPTCSCFNIEDVPCGNDFGRLRTRDSCSFEGYTRMAGDHNPRKPVEDRRNKRFFCKLSYAQSKKYWFRMRGRRCVWLPGDIGMPTSSGTYTQVMD